jgi:hypothetical protein
LEFNERATLVWVLYDWLAAYQPSFAGLSLIVFLSLLLISRLLRRQQPIEPTFVYWQMTMVIILLSAPFTWAMNLVWLLPTGVAVLDGFRRAEGRSQLFVAVAGCLALGLAALPSPLLQPDTPGLLRYQYVWVLLLLLTCLWLWDASEPGKGAASTLERSLV